MVQYGDTIPGDIMRLTMSMKEGARHIAPYLATVIACIGSRRNTKKIITDPDTTELASALL